jgi:hypothetical protein
MEINSSLLAVQYGAEKPDGVGAGLSHAYVIPVGAG